ncbi:Hsp20/alpha crystallin family protein [Agrococcus sp. HG114]|uniref:Hsp20/alpha crystallin family protein n=1 Tax=Agrococcus sp. HG114 TaxID=2969757 RepID=UPI00215A7BE3|nr:Hsp20/alpha crystallin family protein [Agrococcus sp. HG114]MCR8671905.1 Hsp20/alpha crystallin family protein [Agrococcus sp. HG114]
MSTDATRKYPVFPPFTEWVDAFALLGGWDGKGPLPGIRVEELIEDDAFVVHAELPGLDPARDIDVKVEGGTLTIHAERHPDRREKQRSEFRYGALARAIRLPQGADADDITAVYEDGMLTVRVGLVAVPQKVRHIPIERRG